MFINPKSKTQNPREIQSPKIKPFKLEERTAIFSEEIITFLKKLPDNYINRPLASQLIRSATSVGANFTEADAAASKKDFRNKVAICCKECKETKYWIRMLAFANPKDKNACRKLWLEAHELICILSSMIKR